MGLLSFGGSKSKSSSKSASNTFVDPSQQPYLNYGRQQTKGMYDQGPMPVEGVAGINPNLQTSVNDQFAGGNQIANAGGNMMTQGGNMMSQGFGGAMNYANQAMNAGPTQGAGFAIGTGNQYAGGAQGFGAAQGGGANFGMANAMGNSASTAGPASMGAASMGSASMNAATNAGFNQGNLSNYINNDVLQGQINAATRDIGRNLNENQLTASASNAAASGNSGSSRRAVMDAIAARGAADRSADVASSMRGNAYNQALGIESNRAAQNAGFQQGANQANANFQQGANQANAGFQQDSMRANAGFQQNANQFNAGAQNQLRSQGFQMGGNQLQSNLNRQQGADQFNATQYNNARQYGTGMGANAFNANTANNQFGADMSFRGGQAGMGMSQTGANMVGSGLDRAQGSGQYMRDYDQQMENYQYRQGMAPYNSLQFYNQQIGDPNNLSSATSSSKGSSKSASFGFGPAG